MPGLAGCQSTSVGEVAFSPPVRTLPEAEAGRVLQNQMTVWRRTLSCFPGAGAYAVPP